MQKREVFSDTINYFSHFKILFSLFFYPTLENINAEYEAKIERTQE